MEKIALFQNIEHIKNISKDISRIYFGSEFCDYLIPSKKDIYTLVRLRDKRKVPFSIVTPYTNQRNFHRLAELLHYLNVNFPEMEVIVNDWGVLNLIKKRFHNLFIVLGRLLSKQKRGFFTKSKLSGITLIENLNLKKADIEYLKSSILQNEFLMKFIEEAGIKRIGLDNVEQGILLKNKNKNIYIDLYYPYIYITTSNYCLTAPLYKRNNFFSRTDKCDKVCLISSLHEIDVNGKYMLLSGNTQFYFNNQFNYVDRNKIDRLVEMVL